MFNDIKIYITTLGREDRQITLKKIPKKWKDNVYIVCPDYEKHNWENRIDVPEYCIGNLSKTRQWLLDTCDVKFMALFDDDITFLNRIKDRKKTVKNSFKDNSEMFDLFYNWLKSGVDYCGMIHRFQFQNQPEIKYYGKPSYCYFLNREFFLKYKIRFDDIRFYSDFHVPLAVLEFGGVMRYSGLYIANEFKANAPGGCSINRTAELNKQSVFKLRELHPKYVTITDAPGHKNQTLVIDVKMRIAWKKAYEDGLEYAQKNKIKTAKLIMKTMDENNIKLLDFKNITYGCELEIADCDTRIKLPYGKWDYKDGSIANSNGLANDPKKEFNIYGGEINTDPTRTIKEQKNQIKKIYEALGTYKFNHTTNLHLHIRIPGLSSNLFFLKKLQKYIFKYSKELLEYIEPIPKADDNLKGEDFELAKRRERRRKKSHHWAITENTWKRILASETVDEFFNAYYPRTKEGKINYAGAARCAINLSQLKETDTIEFRHFTCTDDIEKIADGFLFCKRFLIHGLTDNKNPIDIFNEGTKKGKYNFPKFRKFNPKIEKLFLMTNVLYNSRKDALENIKKLKEQNII